MDVFFVPEIHQRGEMPCISTARHILGMDSVGGAPQKEIKYLSVQGIEGVQVALGTSKVSGFR